MALRYDPNNVPQPINNMETFLNAILVELRAIRIALQEQNNETTTVRVGNVAKTTTTPVVKK